MSQQKKATINPGLVLMLAGSVLIIVSPSLVWFREKMGAFGMSFGTISVKGSELGDLSDLMGLAGKSIFARGEYVVVLGAFGLLLTAAGVFMPLYRKNIASLTIVVALLALVMGIEPAARMLPAGDRPGEGLFVLAAGSLLLLVGALVSRSGVKVEKLAVSPEASTSAYKPVEESVSSLPSKAETGHDTIPREALASATLQVMPTRAPDVNEAMADRNRLAAVVIGLVVLVILSNVVFSLPGTATRVGGSLYAGNIVKLVILAAMIALVIPARHRLANVISYYLRRFLKTDPAQVPAAVSFSRELSSIIVIAIMWPVIANATSILLRLDRRRDFSWVTITVTLVLLAVLLYWMYRGYQSLQTVLAAAGKGRAGSACPKCGTRNPGDSKFCSSCSTALQSLPGEPNAPGALPCPKCGRRNSPGSRFCNGCGASL